MSDTIPIQLNPSVTQTIERSEECGVDNGVDRGCVDVVMMIEEIPVQEPKQQEYYSACN